LYAAFRSQSQQFLLEHANQGQLLDDEPHRDKLEYFELPVEEEER
jgi:hypothetical protein